MTEGTTPAGWYDDGQGSLRWFDGTTWTEHTSPLPPATPPAPAAAAPAAAAPVAPAAPAVPAAAAPVAAAGVGAAAMSHQYEEHPDVAEPVPFYKKPVFLAVAAGIVVLALIAAFFLTKSSDDTPAASGSTTPTAQTSVPATTAASVDPAAFGQDPSVIAAKATCAVSATIPATAPAAGAQGAQPKAKVACTKDTATYTVVTWNSAADQANKDSLGNAFTQPVTAGTKYYATGDGWTAFDTDYSQAGAQAFATAAGGTTKGVVVVLSATPPAAS